MDKEQLKENITQSNLDKQTKDLLSTIVDTAPFGLWLDWYNRRMNNNVTKPWVICQEGDLQLCYKTFLGKQPSSKDLEISKTFDNGEHRYTIASFYENSDGEYFELTSCCDRLNDDSINWTDFGKLVKQAYKILDEQE